LSSVLQQRSRVAGQFLKIKILSVYSFPPAYTPLFRRIQYSGILVYALISIYFIVCYPGNYSYDLASYLAVAKHYAEGDFVQALNAYWSPLYSWCIALLYKVGVDLFEAHRVVNLLAGGFILLFAGNIILRLRLSILYAVISYLLLLVFTTVYALDMPFPDYMVIAVFMYYLLIAQTDYTQKYYPLHLAWAGVLLYWAKSFFLVFVPAHMLGMLLYYWFTEARTERRTVVVRLGAGLLLFVLFAGVWVSLLSYKYQRFTISSAGRNNSYYTAPGVAAASGTDYLKIPYKSYLCSPWEDPTYENLPAPNPFESKESLQRKIKTIVYNFSIVRYTFGYLSYLGLGLIPLLLWPFFIRVQKSISFYTLSVWACILCMLGYGLIVVNERYLFAPLFVMLVLSFYAVQQIGEYYFPGGKNKWIYLPIVVLSISFLKNPVHLFLEWKKIDHATIGYSYRLINDRLAKMDWLKGSRIASIGPSHLTLLAIKSGAYYCEEFPEGLPSDRMLRELKHYGIDYFFVYGTLPVGFESFPVVFADTGAALTVLDVRLQTQ
jgi:hypothetical protein